MKLIRIASLIGALCLGVMLGVMLGGGTPLVVPGFAGAGAALMVAVCSLADHE